FQNNSANNRFIKDRDFDRILQNGGLSAIEKLDKVIDLFVERFQDLIDNKVSAVDVCYFILPTKVVTALHSLKFGKSFLNLRRKLKARLISVKNTIPTQF